MKKFTITKESPLSELISFAEDESAPSVIKWLEKIDVKSLPVTLDVPKDIEQTLSDLLDNFYYSDEFYNFI